MGLLPSCGGSTPRSKAPPAKAPAARVRTSSTTPVGVRGIPRCAASQLSLTEGDATAASGNIAQAFIITNRFGVSRSLDGYPKVTLLNAAGAAMVTITAHEGYVVSPQDIPHLAPLAAAGGAASFTVGTTDVPTDCLMSSAIEATLPGSISTLTTTERGSVNYCPGYAIYDSPIVAGTHGVAG